MPRRLLLSSGGGSDVVDPPPPVDGGENDSGYDIILLAGQSNMVGQDEDAAPATDSRLWQYPGYGGTPQLVPAHDHLKHPIEARGVGPGMTFAGLYADSVPAYRQVILVPAAVGSTGFTTTEACWKADGSGTVSLYNQAKALAIAAKALGPKNRVTGVLWVQGESDTGLLSPGAALTQAQYGAQLDALIAGFRAAFATPDLPFVVGGMVPSWIAGHPEAAVINAAHADTPNRVAHAAFTAGPSGGANVLPDGVHYSAAGARALGALMFDAYLDARAD